ncbi:MupG family TIM beta-alpha barrel fold protein [Lacticaseibacillus pabuli]|uniref:MupG family TIM beta-alpha barrel fold protein n=1 Tax=Lacticaseibacillus pabuli TaxID=3025672 RepID=A0ABY7WRC4_9LACO|nr:MupG family TIM beta-alpha barrel fold protein [Lacticaseibacillus sp. KACC 23028]WDF82339.1 MupG family TIM beta-alpha barrel fold protein [Lacticaseibacillus sp. KACC 23028]
MFGFSVYLGTAPNDATHAYMRKMARAGFTGVFTSLHIPEDDVTQLAPRLAILAQWCQALDLELIADISSDGFQRMGWKPAEPATVLASGVSGLRIDYGLPMATVAALSHAMPIALNASTLTQTDYDALQETGADFNHIEAWHNYYPRPETGLDRDWYRRKNGWLQSLGLKTMAFIPGDGQQRGPLGDGLPTLEAHRRLAPLAAGLDLQTLHTTRIYVGDNTLTDESIKAYAEYLNEGTICLHAPEMPPVLGMETWHNRQDVARDVIRLAEGRRLQLLDTTPLPTQPRPRGTITLDNDQYQRYAGELQITKRDLPMNSAVNVIGHISADDLALLPFVGAGQAIRLIRE